MGYNIIITGTTGMVGEGVMLVCLNHPDIDEVLSVSRKPNGYVHPKLKEYIVPEFLSLEENNFHLSGYDACFFCAGISSIGMKEDKFTRITYDTTIHFAKLVVKLNPQMIFTYVSGAGTDSTEKGKLMWARVKGKTENDLAVLPFRKVYNFRPGFLKAVTGQKHVLKAYRYFAWMYPLLKILYPNGTSTLEQLALAMIHTLAKGYDKTILEVKDIKALAGT